MSEIILSLSYTGVANPLFVVQNRTRRSFECLPALKSPSLSSVFYAEHIQVHYIPNNHWAGLNFLSQSTVNLIQVC